jgi:lipid A 4'-phosphatase
MKATAIYFAVFGSALALSLLLPQIDLAMSALFYTSAHGFLLKNWAPVALLYNSIPWLAWGIFGVVSFGSCWLLLFERPLWRLDRKALCFIALSMVLAPGFIVNTVLKDHWGRARPNQIAAFGGTQEFSPAPLPARQCSRNCSFPSGHAALGFSLVAFAFLLPHGTSRRCAVAAALGFGALIGLARIAQGAHFLSDVVCAGLLVYGTVAALHWWIVKQDGLASARLRQLYRTAGRAVCSSRSFAASAWASPLVHLGSGTAAVAILVTLSAATLDRPLALFFHTRDPGIHALLDLIGRLGRADGWLTVFAIAFVALHWGGILPRLRSSRRRLRVWSAIPAFLFASIASSGIVVDVLKVIFGRARPKLLFGADFYGFTWFGWSADHWSFPSGHAATIVALLTALWCLWPSHLLFYMLVGAIVAASRIVGGAHFLGDAIAGAWLGVLITRGVMRLFVRGGIDLAAARRPPPGEMSPWICRRAGGIANDLRGLLAPKVGAVVSARHNDAADRNLRQPERREHPLQGADPPARGSAGAAAAGGTRRETTGGDL